MIKVKFYSWDDFIKECNEIIGVPRISFKIENSEQFDTLRLFYFVAGYIKKIKDVYILYEFKAFIGHFFEGDTEKFENLFNDYEKLEKHYKAELEKLGFDVLGGIYEVI